MFVDSHCHLSFPDFDHDRDLVIRRLADAGVRLLIDPGTNLETSRQSIALAKLYPFIYANVGLHPHDVTQACGEETIEQLAGLATSPKVVGIGEIGLDYHYPEYDTVAQETLFREMLRVAARLDKPVIIHCRDAWSDMLRILHEEQHSGLRGIMHCFSGDIDIARTCIALGFKLSIPGTVTYKRSLLPEVIAQVSLTDLLTETDAPYLAPVPHRGTRNEPAHVALVTLAIAAIRQEPPDMVAATILDNAARLFDITPEPMPLF